MSNTQKGLMVLRYGLAILLMWFGYSQILDPSNWIGWVPLWTETKLHMVPATVVLFNGLFEILGGTLLAMNIFPKWVAWILSAHLALVTYEVGLNEVGVRDFGLTISTIALALMSGEKVKDTSSDVSFTHKS